MSRAQGSVYSPLRGVQLYGTMLRPSLRWAAFEKCPPGRTLLLHIISR